MSTLTPTALARQVAEAPAEEQDQLLAVHIAGKGVPAVLASDKRTRPALERWTVSHVIEPGVSFDDALEMLGGTALGYLAAHSPSVRESIIPKILESGDRQGGLAVLAVVITKKSFTEVNWPEIAKWMLRWPNDTRTMTLISQIWSLSGVQESVLDLASTNLAVAALVAAVDPSRGPELLKSELVEDSEGEDWLQFLNVVCITKQARLEVATKFNDRIMESVKEPEIAVLAYAVRTKLIAGGATTLNGAQAAEELDEISKVFEEFIRLIPPPVTNTRRRRGSVGSLNSVRTTETSATALSSASITSVASISTAAHGPPADDFEEPDRDIRLEAATEGLAATSLLPSVRNRVASIVPQLSQLVKARDASVVYAALVILTNLVEYPMRDTAEQARIKELAAQAQGGPSAWDIQTRPEVEEIGKWVDAVIGTRIVDWLAQRVPTLSSTGRTQVALMLRNMAYQQTGGRRLKLAAQGLVVTCTYLWKSLEPSRALDESAKCVAASAVAKVLVSIPPPAAFTQKVKPSAVLELLRSQLMNDTSPRPNLDTLESLMALTNLASMGDGALVAGIARKVFPRVEGVALGTEYVPIQRAAVELMCNMAPFAAGAEVFLQRSPSSNALLSLLGHLLLSEDHASQLAAAGALAMLSEWETAPETIGLNEDVIECLIKSLPDNNVRGDKIDYDLLLRQLSIIVTLVEASREDRDVEIAESIIYCGGMPKLDELVERVDLNAHEGAVSKLLLKSIKLLAEFRSTA